LILHRGGLLHDVGKIGTPSGVLEKPGKLDPEELKVMRDHVRMGVRILEPIPSFKEELLIVAQHHEWYDGSGYPAGLAGENISLFGRIFAVADCFDALTSDRPYRKGMPTTKALELIRNESGTHFDPQVIRAFDRMLAEGEGLGSPPLQGPDLIAQLT
jgi:putative nucleotidyltransferase with HDIG domain